MNDKIVLITGGETLLGRKLIEKHLARGCHVVAPIAAMGSERNQSKNNKLLVIPWNRASWFSIKTVVRETMRTHGRIDSVLLIYHDPKTLSSTITMEPGEVEKVLDYAVKGAVSLTRETYSILENAGGFLGFAIPHRIGPQPGPLDALALGAFTSFAQSTFHQAGMSLWSCGFFSSSTDTETFADTILEFTETRPPKLKGQWLRFADGRRPFGGTTIHSTMTSV